MGNLFKDKQAGLTDIFLFMIISLVIIFISVIFIYIGGRITGKLHEKMDGMDIGTTENASQVIDSTVGKANQSYNALYWISVFLIVGMVLSIFIGSYMVTTKPIFFIPYIFIVIIATVVSIGISNAYETVKETPALASTFEGFVGANFIMSYLPIWVVVISMTGGIIMFARMGSKENELYGGFN